MTLVICIYLLFCSILVKSNLKFPILVIYSCLFYRFLAILNIRYTIMIMYYDYSFYVFIMYILLKI